MQTPKRSVSGEKLEALLGQLLSLPFQRPQQLSIALVTGDRHAGLQTTDQRIMVAHCRLSDLRLRRAGRHSPSGSGAALGTSAGHCLTSGVRAVRDAAIAQVHHGLFGNHINLV